MVYATGGIMEPKVFYRLLEATIKKMKQHKYDTTSVNQWMIDLKGMLYEELAENFDNYPEEE